MLMDQRVQDGRTALIQASQNGHEGAVMRLLEGKADVNAAAKDRVTALYVACQNGHEGSVVLLLKRNADVNAAAEDGRTALLQAGKNGHERTVLRLLEGRADVNAAHKDGWTALILAGQNGHERTVLRLLEGRADVNAAHKDGWTALIQASQNGHEGAVMRLLEGKADVNAAAKTGVTALMLVGLNGYEGVVVLLLEGKANVNAAAKDGRTTLMLASKNGHERMVVRLLEGRVDVNAAAKNGQTALYLAGQNGHKEVVVLLLEGKADVSAADESGRTVLHVAAQGGKLGTVQALLAAAADPASRMRAGDTPLSLSASARSWDCASALLQALLPDRQGLEEGQEVADALSRRDAVGWTAVHYALVAAGGGAPAADWLEAAEWALGGGGRKLLDVARGEVATAAAARTVAGPAWPERWRGASDVVSVVEGPVPAVVGFSGFGTARAGCYCPVGARGYYELEILHCETLHQHGGTLYQVGFCGADWPAIKGESGNGVGDDGNSWGADGARGTWWSGSEGGRAGYYRVSWMEGDVLGLACDLAGGEGRGRILVAVNGDWSGCEALDLPAEMPGLLPVFSAKEALLRCNLAGPFRHAPPAPDYLPMASFPALPPT